MTPGSFVWHIFLNLGCFPWLAPTLRLSHLRPPCSRPMFVKSVIGIYSRFSIITRLREVRCIEWWPTQHFKLDPFKRKNAGNLNIRFMSWENYSGSCLEKVAQVVQPWLRLYRLSVLILHCITCYGQDEQPKPASHLPTIFLWPPVDAGGGSPLF